MERDSSCLDFWLFHLRQANFCNLKSNMPRSDNRRIPKTPGNPAVCFIIRFSCFFQPFIHMGHIGIPCCLQGQWCQSLDRPVVATVGFLSTFQAFSASDFSRSRACSRVKPHRIFFEQKMKLHTFLEWWLPNSSHTFWWHHQKTCHSNIMKWNDWRPRPNANWKTKKWLKLPRFRGRCASVKTP